MVNTVAQYLPTVRKQLDEMNVKYLISTTRPTRHVSNLDEDCLYVIRQQIDTNGVYHLTVAAKMGK